MKSYNLYIDDYTVRVTEYCPVLCEAYVYNKLGVIYKTPMFLYTYEAEDTALQYIVNRRQLDWKKVS